MGTLTDLAENDLLDYAFGGTAVGFTPGTTYLALYTVTPSDAGGGTEVTNANNYSRQAITWSAASGGSKTTSADVVFTATGGNWGTVVAVGILDSGTHGVGNMLAWKLLDSSATVNDTDTLTFSAGNITVTLD